MERPSRFQSRGGSPAWVLSLAALTGVTALSIDMSLPAQPAIARELGVASGTAQLTLSLFLIGFACSQIVFGTLSDAIGRRPILLAGLAVFTLAGAACALSSAIGVLLVARFVQGIGASAAPVVARAMVRDRQSTSDAARTLSSIMAVLAVAPMIAPVIGAALLARFGWPAIFVALTLLGIALLLLSAATLAETLPPERRVPLSFVALRGGMARYFGTRATLAPTALVCLSFVGQFSFISNSPFVLIDGYGVSPQRFSLYFGATALALMVGSVIGRRLLQHTTPRRVLVFGACGLCAGGLLVFAGTNLRELGPLGVVAPMLVYCVGVGLTFPSATAVAMEPVAAIAGLASAILGSLQMVSGALAGYVVSRLGGREPYVLGTTLALAGTLACALALVSSRRR
ncbi:MAG TPA: multidrug effflux MFS transporter [Polyangiales bacterium]|nr:multidrug effflux MFS transporter [Polyangiales bacterium]